MTADNIIKYPITNNIIHSFVCITNAFFIQKLRSHTDCAHVRARARARVIDNFAAPIKSETRNEKIKLPADKANQRYVLVVVIALSHRHENRHSAIS